MLLLFGAKKLKRVSYFLKQRYGLVSRQTSSQHYEQLLYADKLTGFASYNRVKSTITA
jgi:hypothetical protein